MLWPAWTSEQLHFTSFRPQCYDIVCLFLDLKFKDYFRPVLPLPPPPHPLFSFYPGLFQVSGSDLGQECQWCAHSQQLVLMAVPHASNRGRSCSESDGAKCHCVQCYGERGQCQSSIHSSEGKQLQNHKARLLWYSVSHLNKCQLQYYGCFEALLVCGSLICLRTTCLSAHYVAFPAHNSDRSDRSHQSSHSGRLFLAKTFL